MATFYYKTVGLAGPEFNISNAPSINEGIQIGTVDVNLKPITDGQYLYKCVVTCPDQACIDAFEANITVAEGTAILTQTEYDAL